VLLGACTPHPSPEPVPSPEVGDAAGTRDAALSYLKIQSVVQTPDPGGSWEAELTTPSGLVGGTTWEFTQGDWFVEVSYPVVAPENTIYTVMVLNTKLGWHWKGTVKAEGAVTQVSPFKQMSQEESQKVAEEFVKSSPTFMFDGIEDTLLLADTWTARCPFCWISVYEFDSANAGYGDRTGQALAEVITHHRAVITVQQLEVTSAIMDEKWDMIKQAMLGEGEEPEGAISVAELLANPVYDNEVTIYGTVSLLGELLCPCFELTSGGQSIQVWYGLMVENNAAERPPVDVGGINNGDEVILAGELKGGGGIHYSQGDFWLTEIASSSPPELEIRLAPIHDVQINIAESYPPQIFVYIKGGLSDGCTTFHKLDIRRSASTIDIEVTTKRPKDAVCSEIYGFFERNVNLGSDFISGENYTVKVNEVTTSFVMQ